jgi:exportin-T
MVEFLVLVNQIICKFKSSASAILEEVFPTIASHLSVILSQDAFSAGPASNTEVILICLCKQATVYITLFSSCLYLVYFFYVSACLYIAKMLMPLKCANLGDILHYLLFFFMFSYL